MDDAPQQETVGAPPLLSILLPTVQNRAELFAKLHAHVAKQAAGKPVEVLVACDNKEISIGAKRQQLLKRATGEYVAYIDDDDWVSDDYVDRFLAALTTRPDCVGFRISCTVNGGKPKKAIASMRYPRWVENQDGYAHCRSIYHKTPVLRSIALRVGFPDIRYGEDRPYSEGVMKLVKREEFIDAEIYHYRFRSEPFAEKYGIKGARGRRYGHGVNYAHKRRPFQH